MEEIDEIERQIISHDLGDEEIIEPFIGKFIKKRKAKARAAAKAKARAAAKKAKARKAAIAAASAAAAAAATKVAAEGAKAAERKKNIDRYFPGCKAGNTGYCVTLCNKVPGPPCYVRDCFQKNMVKGCNATINDRELKNTQIAKMAFKKGVNLKHMPICVEKGSIGACGFVCDKTNNRFACNARDCFKKQNINACKSIFRNSNFKRKTLGKKSRRNYNRLRKLRRRSKKKSSMKACKRCSDFRRLCSGARRGKGRTPIMIKKWRGRGPKPTTIMMLPECRKLMKRKTRRISKKFRKKKIEYINPKKSVSIGGPMAKIERSQKMMMKPRECALPAPNARVSKWIKPTDPSCICPRGWGVSKDAGRNVERCIKRRKPVKQIITLGSSKNEGFSNMEFTRNCCLIIFILIIVFLFKKEIMNFLK